MNPNYCDKEIQELLIQSGFPIKQISELHFYFTPTLYDAQMWLIEQGIRIAAIPIPHSNKWHYYSDCLENNNLQEFNTYQEALSFGIKESLKQWNRI